MVENDVKETNAHKTETNSRSTSTHSQSQRIFDTLKQGAITEIQSLVEGYLERVVNDFFDRADHAASNSIQQYYLESRQAIQAKGFLFQNAFKAEITARIDSFFMQEQNEGIEAIVKTAEVGDELSLVDDHALEQDLTLKTMVSQADKTYQEALFALAARLSELLQRPSIEAGDLPIGPEQLCASLQATISVFEVDIGAKILLYRLFDGAVLKRLSNIYERLNQVLIDQGVLPRLKHTIRKSAVTTQTAAAANLDNSPSTANDDADEADQQLSSDLYQVIRNLQSNLREQPATQTASGAEAADLTSWLGASTAINEVFSPPSKVLAQGIGIAQHESTPVFSHDELVSALTAIQKNQPRSQTKVDTSKELVDHSAHLLNQELKKLIAEGHDGKLSALDADTIDLVGMLFNYMLDDKALPDSVKAILSHLHTPFLKIAVRNKQLFIQRKHPARRLMNTMADAGSRWVAGAGGDAVVLAKIQHTVDRVLNEFEDNVDLLAELLGEFRAFVEARQQRSALTEKRTLETAKGRERIEAAKQSALAELDQRIASHPLPQAAIDLLSKPWADFLSFNYLRYGENSGQWQQALANVDELVALFEAHRSAVANDEANTQTTEFNQHLRQRQVELWQGFRQGLMTTGYHQNEIDRLLEPIEETLLALDLEQARRPFDENDDRRPRQNWGRSQQNSISTSLLMPKKNTLIKTAAQVKEEIPSLHREIADALTTIEFGTWFDKVEGDTVKRIKLSWYSPVSTNYLFVDSYGIKVGVIPLNELAKHIFEGSMQIVAGESLSLFDRAMQAIADTLKLATGRRGKFNIASPQPV